MFDAFSWLALGSIRPIGRREGTNAEELIWLLASLGFPILDCILTLVALSNDSLSPVIMLGIPIWFTALTVYLCRRGRADLGWAVQSVFVCLLFCLGASVAAGFLSFLSTF